MTEHNEQIESTNVKLSTFSIGEACGSSNLMKNLRAVIETHPHTITRYGEQLFTPEILKMKKENPSLDEKTIRKAFRLTPHDFRRTAITRALDMGESYRRVMNASRHKSITSVQRYDLHRNAMEENSILTLNYNDK